MNFQIVPFSEGRSKLTTLRKQVVDNGEIVVLTVNGKAEVALIDFELLQEFLENAEFGISLAELKRRANEDTVGVDCLTVA